MPSVNLRLTDEQHRLLSEDAKRNDRSLQREIIHRLFRWPTVAESAQAEFAQNRQAKPDPKPGHK